MIKLSLREVLTKKEIVDLWDTYPCTVMITNDDDDIVFLLFDNNNIDIDELGLIDDGEWTDVVDKYIVTEYRINKYNDETRIVINIVDKYAYTKTRTVLVTVNEEEEIVVHSDGYYYETTRSSIPLELIAIANVFHYTERDLLVGELKGAKIYFEIAHQGDNGQDYYYFNRLPWQ